MDYRLLASDTNRMHHIPSTPFTYPWLTWQLVSLLLRKQRPPSLIGEPWAPRDNLILAIPLSLAFVTRSPGEQLTTPGHDRPQGRHAGPAADHFPPALGTNSTQSIATGGDRPTGASRSRRWASQGVSARGRRTDHVSCGTGARPVPRSSSPALIYARKPRARGGRSESRVRSLQPHLFGGERPAGSYGDSSGRACAMACRDDDTAETSSCPSQASLVMWSTAGPWWDSRRISVDPIAGSHGTLLNLSNLLPV